MATDVIKLSKNKWTLVYAGPTDRQIYVERQSPCPSVWIAVSADIPTFQANGHYLDQGDVKYVELEPGENLYAWLADTPGGYPPGHIIITD
ncbi:hypothetical protein [Enterobacter asburiae]|uniref:hypothetical protein n=1 Tax=Enterobacter asburiae TaxID=61645 RepID=UPI003EE42C5D